MTVDQINLLYHEDALSGHIEAMEPLFRMDEGKRAEIETKLVGGMIKTPDESRAKFGLAPTAGGNTLWGQHQDYPLGTLANRLPPDQKPAEPVPDAQPAVDDGAQEQIERGIRAITALNTIKAVDAARSEAFR